MKIFWLYSVCEFLWSSFNIFPTTIAQLLLVKALLSLKWFSSNFLKDQYQHMSKAHIHIVNFHSSVCHPKLCRFFRCIQRGRKPESSMRQMKWNQWKAYSSFRCVYSQEAEVYATYWDTCWVSAGRWGVINYGLRPWNTVWCIWKHLTAVYEAGDMHTDDTNTVSDMYNKLMMTLTPSSLTSHHLSGFCKTTKICCKRTHYI